MATVVAMPVPAPKLLLNLVGIVGGNWTSAEEVRLMQSDHCSEERLGRSNARSISKTF